MDTFLIVNHVYNTYYKEINNNFLLNFSSIIMTIYYIFYGWINKLLTVTYLYNNIVQNI